MQARLAQEKNHPTQWRSWRRTVPKRALSVSDMLLRTRGNWCLAIAVRTVKSRHRFVSARVENRRNSPMSVTADSGPLAGRQKSAKRPPQPARRSRDAIDLRSPLPSPLGSGTVHNP